VAVAVTSSMAPRSSSGGPDPIPSDSGPGSPRPWTGRDGGVAGGPRASPGQQWPPGHPGSVIGPRSAGAQPEPRLLGRRAVKLAIALVLSCLTTACAEGGLRLPRLRVRGWIGITDRSDVGGELGLVMPLDPPFSSAATEDETDEELDVPLDVIGRAARCRVPLACGWEEAERARALARLEGREP
jgi:hypothetical protein